MHTIVRSTSRDLWWRCLLIFFRVNKKTRTSNFISRRPRLFHRTVLLSLPQFNASSGNYVKNIFYFFALHLEGNEEPSIHSKPLRFGWRNWMGPFVTNQNLRYGSSYIKHGRLWQIKQFRSRLQQGRQSEPSVKTLRSPLSAAFWRYCVLSGRTQRRA